jgi:hypothetical protein
MEGVTFTDEQSATRYAAPSAHTGGMVGFLTRTRFVENERQAITWLIAVVVIALIAAIGIWLLSSDKQELPPNRVINGIPLQMR